MTSYVTPKKNTAFILYVGLEDKANAGLFKAAPTLAAGDFKVSIDGGTLNNLTDLPTVTPTGGRMVKITLTAAEMNGDNVTVVCSDAAGAEWYDLIINLQTTTRQIDDLAYPTVSGRSLDVSATGEAGVDWANVGSPTTSVALTGTQINSVLGSVGGNVEGKVLGGGSGTITGTGASADVTMWKGDVPRDLDVSGNVMASATIADKRVSGFVGASGVAEAIAFDATMSPSFIGQSSVPYSPGISYDNAFINWTFVIEDGNSGIAFATVVTGSDAATDMLSLRDPVPDPGFVVTDDIAFLLLPFAPSASVLNAQETADAVNNLAPTGTGAAGSIRANLVALPAAVDSQLSGTHGADAWGAGTGVFSKVYTVTSGGLPVDGVYCRLTTDAAGLVNVDAGTTNAAGQVTFHHNLAAGTTVYIHRSKAGYTPVAPEPDVEVI